MAKKVKANGKTFTFEDNVTDEQIGSAIDEYFTSLKKKGQSTVESTTTSTPSSIGGMTDLSGVASSKVDTTIPSPLTYKGGSDYIREQLQPKIRQTQPTLGRDYLGEKKGESKIEKGVAKSFLPNAPKDFSVGDFDPDLEGIGAPILPSNKDLGKSEGIQDSKYEAELKALKIKEEQKAKNATGGAADTFMANVAGVNKSLAKIPRFLYDLAAVPQNFAADMLNMPELKGNYNEVLQASEYQSPLSVIDRLGDLAAGEQDKYNDRVKKYDDDIIGSLSKGNFADAGAQVINNIAGSIPSMILMSTTGGIGSAAKFGYYGKTLLNALPFASGKMQEISGDPTIPEYIKPITASLNGLAEVIFDQKFGTQAAINNIIKIFKQSGKEAADIAAKEFTEGYVKKALKQLGSAGKSISKGSLEEVTTTFAQNLSDKYTINPDKNLMDGVADAAIVGGITTGGFEIGGKVLAGRYNKNQKNELTTLAQQRSDIIDDLDKENVSEEVKSTLKDALDAVDAKIDGITEDAENEIDIMPSQVQGVITEKQREIESLSNQLQDENISEVTKQIITDKIKSLESEVNFIIDNANKEQEKITESQQEVEQPKQEIKIGDRVKIGDNVGELGQDADGTKYLILDDGTELVVANAELETATPEAENRNFRVDANGFIEINDKIHLEPKVDIDDNGVVSITSKVEGKPTVIKGQLAENIAYQLKLNELEELTDADAEQLLGEATTNQDIQNLIAENEKRNEELESKRTAEAATQKGINKVNESPKQRRTEALKRRDEAERVKNAEDDIKAADELVFEQMQVPDGAVVMHTPKGKAEDLAYTVTKGKKGLVILLNGNRVRNENVINAVTEKYNANQSLREEEAYNAAHNQLENLKRDIYKENGFDYKPEYIGKKSPVSTKTEVKKQEDAIQKPSTESKVSPVGEAGQVITEGGEGVRQGEQGKEAAQEVKPTEEVTKSQQLLDTESKYKRAKSGAAKNTLLNQIKKLSTPEQFNEFTKNNVREKAAPVEVKAPQIAPPVTKSDQVANDLLSFLGIEEKPKVQFSKKEQVADTTESIVDEMNALGGVNMNVNVSDVTSQKGVSDVDTFKGRKGIVLQPKIVSIADFNGIPMMVTISDELTTGEVINPITGKTIDNLNGGLGFNYSEGNTEYAWAYTNSKVAQDVLNYAKEIYNANPGLYPDGIVPVAIVKMGKSAMVSNEAIVRQLIQNLSDKKIPQKNKINAFNVLSADVKQQLKTVQARIDKAGDNASPSDSAAKRGYTEILKLIDSVKTFDELLGKLTTLNIGTRPLLIQRLISGNADIVPADNRLSVDKPASKALMEGLDKSEYKRINIGHLVNNLTEPSLRGVPDKHIIGFVGIDATADGPVEIKTHPNYPAALKGKGLGLLKETVHIANAMPSAYGNVLSKLINAEESGKAVTNEQILSSGLPAALNNKVLRNKPLSERTDAYNKVLGYLQLALPNTNFFTDQKTWDDMMSSPDVKKYLKKGDVVYGMTKDGHIYLNPKYESLNTPIHEAGHVHIDFLEQNNPELFSKGISLLEGTKELKDAIRELGDTVGARKEAMAVLIGNKGESIVNDAKKAEFKEWLISVYKYIQSKFPSLRSLTPEQVSNLTLDQFVNGMVKDVLGAKEITVGKEKKGKAEFSKENIDPNFPDKIIIGEQGSEPLLKSVGLEGDKFQEWKDKNGLGEGRQAPISSVKQAAIDLKSGKTANIDSYIKTVRENQPIIPFTSVPKIPSLKRVVGSLRKNQLEFGIIGVNAELKDGAPVALRLDIPAYNAYNTWIVSIHDGRVFSDKGKSIAYSQTGVIKDVKFLGNQGVSLKIATEETNKTTIARMFGSWKNESPKEVHDRAEKIMKEMKENPEKSEWVQVGMNPYRHSWFYDKADGNPLVSADEILQVGALVLGKNVKKIEVGSPEFVEMFSTKNVKGETIQFSKTNNIDKIQQFVASQREQGISDADIKLALEKVADQVGIDASDIDVLLNIPAKEIAQTIRNKDVAEKREIYGFDEPLVFKRQANQETIDKAVKAIKSGVNPLDVIQKALNREAITDVEDVIINIYQQNKEKELFDIDNKIENSPNSSVLSFEDMVNKRDKIFEELLKSFDASQIAGNVTARSLQARKIALRQDYSLASMIVKARKANNNEQLSKKKSEDILKSYKNIVAAKKALEARVAQLEELQGKGELNSFLRDVALEERSKKRVETKEQLKSERESLFKQFKDLIKSSRSELSANPIKLEMFPIIAKLAKNYFKDGIVTTEGIVDKLYNDLADSIEGLTKAHIVEALVKSQEDTRPTQEELIEDLDNSKKELDIVSQEDVDKKEQARLDTYKKGIQKRIDQLSGKIKNKDYAKKKPNPILRDAEAIKLQREYAKLKYQFDLDVAKDKLAKRSLTEKIIDSVLDKANIPRALMASFDFSAPLRQSLTATISHPILAIKAGAQMFKQGFSVEKAENWLLDLKESDGYQLIEDSGLYIADATHPEANAREEDFGSNLANYVPGVKVSERAYSAYLNKMRVDIFSQGVNLLLRDGMTFANNPDAYKSLATFVNASTGRGDMGKLLERTSKFLTPVFFSPRFLASRLQLLSGSVIYKAPPAVRKMYARDMISTILFGVVVLGLFKANGADVEDDPRSSDFGKIRIGNTRWDIWGGFQQPIRYIAQFITGQKKSSASGKIEELDGTNYNKQTRLGVLGNFLRSKLAPIPALAVDAMAGENMVGERFDLIKNWPKLITPLVAQGIYDSANQDGWVFALTATGLPSVFGVGVQSYAVNNFLQKGVDDKSLKLLLSKKATAIEPNEHEKMIYDIKTGKERKMTSEEFKKYYDTWATYIKQNLDENHDYYSKMSNESFEEKFRKMKTQASISAKESVTGITPSTKKIEITIDGNQESIDLSPADVQFRKDLNDDFIAKNRRIYTKEFLDQIKNGKSSAEAGYIANQKLQSAANKNSKEIILKQHKIGTNKYDF